MSIINSQPLIGASGNQVTGYNLTKSLRFRQSASAYLNRTPASSGNAKTWTWSGWVKVNASTTSLGENCFFSAGTNANGIYYSDNQIGIDGFYNGTRVLRYSTAKFRDPSAWYHVVVVVDTTQATDSNRLKLYVNGVQFTLDQANVGTYPAQNSDGVINTNVAHSIGRRQNIPDLYYDGYLAENHFIDGQALTPSDFGETDTATGVWKPKKYTGTYGTNGFYLPFTDTTSTSTLGTDFSGNSNTWTVNNISLTSGSTYDSMTDVPTLTNATTANYCVMNPLNTLATLSSANLKVTNSAASNQGSKATFLFPTTSLWYCECVVAETTTASKQIAFGLGTPSVALNISTSTANSWGLAASDSSFIIRNGSQSSTLSFGVFTAGTVLQLAVDLANSRAWLGINNTWYNSTTGTDGNPSAGTNPTLTSLPTEVYPFVFALYQNSCDVNFGQRPFAYTPPTGFVALNTFNLPTPAIGATASTTANKYFDINLWTGTGTTNVITNSGSMQPDFVWAKRRSSAASHGLVDSVRGTGKTLFSNLTDAEDTGDSNLTAFNSNGFTAGSGGNFNTSEQTYVGWQWRASGSTTNITVGQYSTSPNVPSIASTVSANTTAGFSIATFTSPSSGTASFGHGLGVTPSFVIVKSRASGNWICQHTSTGAQYLLLNDTGAAVTDSTVWNSAFTSTVVNIGTGFAGTVNYVAYCFAQVAGYSAFGLYTGNGVSDGPFIYTGFRPRFVMIKASGTTGAWSMTDTSRDPYNLTINKIEANTALSEASNAGLYQFDILSNGFKIRQGTGYGINNSADYIYMAFAENPFKYANAR